MYKNKDKNNINNKSNINNNMYLKHEVKVNIKT